MGKLCRARADESKLVSDLMSVYGISHSHIKKEDYEMLINGTIFSGMFSYGTLHSWFDKTIPYLTQENLKILRKNDMFNFLLKESHVDEFLGYKPLSETGVLCL